MRAFIAIDLPGKIKDSLAEIQGKLKTVLPKVNWVKPENLHFTLKFLGEISPGQLSNIEKIAEEITNSTADFKIKLTTFGVFPATHIARIIWIGAQLPLALKQLVERLEAKLAESGLPKEQRPFKAHITIARIKNPLNPADLERTLDQVRTDLVYTNLEFNSGEITLFQSTLGPGGPTYTALKKLNLRII